LHAPQIILKIPARGKLIFRSVSIFLQQPALDGRDRAFKFRVWVFSLFTARLQLKSLKVKGPLNQEVWRNGLI